MATSSNPNQEPMDVFPRFVDGDVLIVLSPSRHYLLHARTLRMHSTFLAKLLDEDNGVELSSRARRDGAKIRWRVEYSMAARGELGVGTFTLRELDDRGRASGQGAYNFSSSSLHSGHLPEQIYHDYDTLFSAYYYQPINIRTDDGLNSVLRDVVGLTSVAEYLGSMRIVALPIDNALLKQGQNLWNAVARAPWAWADLAVRVRSELVFNEAIVHLVGQWPRLTEQASQQAIGLLAGAEDTGTDLLSARKTKTNTHYDDLDMYGLDDPENRAHSKYATTPNAHHVLRTLRPSIRALILAKHTELDATKLAIEMRIMGHYPTHLHRNGGPNGDPNMIPNVNAQGARTQRGRGNPLRSQSYGADILAWMALNLFRHWLGQHISGDRNRHSTHDGGAGFYKALHAGGSAYIDHASLNNFCVYFPLSAKSRATLEEQMGLLKETVRPFVAPLCKVNLALELSKAERLDYLCCALVVKDDLPWVGGRAEMPWASDEAIVNGPPLGSGGGARKIPERPKLGGQMELSLPAHGEIRVQHTKTKTSGKDRQHKPRSTNHDGLLTPPVTATTATKRSRGTDYFSSPPPIAASTTHDGRTDEQSPSKRARKHSTKSHHKTSAKESLVDDDADLYADATPPTASSTRAQPSTTPKSFHKSRKSTSNANGDHEQHEDVDAAQRLKDIQAQVDQQYGLDDSDEDAEGNQDDVTMQHETVSTQRKIKHSKGHGKADQALDDEDMDDIMTDGQNGAEEDDTAGDDDDFDEEDQEAYEAQAFEIDV